MNYRIIVRLVLLTFTALLFFVVKKFNGYDFLIVLFLFVGLLLNYKEGRTGIEAVSNYVFWLLMLFMISNYKGFDITKIKDAFFILLVLKLGVLIVNYIKFRKVFVTSTYISKFWIFTLFLYLSEIILNSTHGLKNTCFYIGIISVLESLIVILVSKNLKHHLVSFLNVLKNS